MNKRGYHERGKIVAILVANIIFCQIDYAVGGEGDGEKRVDRGIVNLASYEFRYNLVQDNLV